MMMAVDLLIAKPGPGTIMEAVISELPMILDGVSEPMPQECGNLDFALAHGIGRKLTDYRDLPAMVRDLQADTAATRQLQANMHALKNPQAIYEIADILVGHLQAPHVLVG
jgi:UDP-N-acetylglucosamine:LPS N-acetylglucosamine transferase